MIHRWETRTKLVSLLALIFGMAAVTDGRWLPLLLSVSVGLYALAGLSWRRWWQRLRLPGGLLLLGLLSLPFWVGTTLWLSVAGLSVYREGIVLLGLLLGRFVAIMTVAQVLLETTPLLLLLQASRSLGVPILLTDMALLTYRYLAELAEQFQTLQMALRLRGLERANWQTLAALLGTLLIRSYRKADQVYLAMQLRGYGQISEDPIMLPPSRRDRLSCAACVSLAVLWLSVAS
ncbi:MAG: cobalt ECF transporter T component CbiQ [Synechococcaceae cyanobacterium SM2_3_60]|nr:cobalt ECF transporter T component CbiQ [Synechococcaceae cyanobacterium SM2_3_60]